MPFILRGSMKADLLLIKSTVTLECIVGNTRECTWVMRCDWTGGLKATRIGGCGLAVTHMWSTLNICSLDIQSCTLCLLTASKFQGTSVSVHWEVLQLHGTLCRDCQSGKRKPFTQSHNTSAASASSASAS